MFDDFMEADIFREAKAGPFSEQDIHDEGEQDEPWSRENEIEQRIPAEERISDDGDDERLCSENKSDASPFLDLCGDEFLGESDQDEKRENGDGCQPGTILHASEDEDAEDGERDDGEGDGDAREIEQAKSLEEPPREHADHDDRDEDGDTVFHAIRIESEEGEGDDGGRIDAECLDADDLAEQSDERRDNREEEKECHRLERDAGIDEKSDDGMDRHRQKIIKSKLQI